MLSGTWPRRIALGLLLLIGGVVALAWTTRLDEQLVGRLLSARLGTPVEVHHLGWRGSTLVAEGVRAKFEQGADPFFTAPSVDVVLATFGTAIERVVITGPTLVLNERADGTFDLAGLRREGGGAPELIPIEVRDGRLELRGAGPLHERLHDLLAPTVPLAAAVETLVVTPLPGDRFALQAVVIPGGVARLHLQGSGSMSAGLEQLQVRVSADRPLALDELQSLTAPAIADWLRANAMKGAVAGEARLDAHHGPAFAVDLDLLDVEFVPEVFPTTLSGLTGRMEFRGGDLSFREIIGRHEGGRVVASGKIEDLQGEARGQIVVTLTSAVVDDELNRALLGDRIGKQIVEAFAPEGRYTVVCTIGIRKGTPPHLDLDLELEDTAAVFHGFPDAQDVRHGLPLRVERIRGQVRATPEETHFEDVVGFTRGGARLEASCHMIGEKLEGSVRAFGVPIDEELIVATEKEVGTTVRELVAMLGLSGTFDAEARYHMENFKDPFHLSVTLRPKQVDILSPSFPYPLRFDGGELELDFDHGQVLLRGLRGGRETGGVRLDGFITTGTAAPVLDLTLDAHDVAFDSAMKEASLKLVDQRLAQLLDRLAPEGSVDLTLHWKREIAGGPMAMSVRVAPHAVSVHLAEGKLVVSDIGGSFLLTSSGSEAWALALSEGPGLVGSMFGGAVEMRGALDEGFIGPDLRGPPGGILDVSAHRLQVDPRLIEALRPAAPDVAELLEIDQVSGRLRVDCSLALREGVLVPTVLHLAPDFAPDASEQGEEEGVSVQPPWLAMGLIWTGGSLRADLDEHVVMFDRIEGRLGSAALVLDDGVISFQEDGLTSRLAADVEGLTFNEVIELVLGPEKRAALAPYGPLGRTRARIEQLTLHLPAGAKELDRFDVKGRVDFSGWTFYTAGALRELTGRLELTTLNYTRRGNGVVDVVADGRIAGTTLELGNLRFGNIEADLVLREGRLSVPWLSADFAGGRLLRERNHLGVGLTGEMPLDGRLELFSGDVSRVLGDDQPRMRGLSGRMDADVGFHGDLRPLFRGQGMTSVEAAGKVSVYDAKLWSIPVFDKLYARAIQRLVGADEADEPPRFDRGELEFALRGVYVRLTKVELEGEPLVLRGEGTLAPERLTLNFYPELKAGLGFVRSIPIVGPIVGFLLSIVEHEVGAFRFQGPYGDPQVEWDPVSLVPRPDLKIGLERPRTSTPREETPLERF